MEPSIPTSFIPKRPITPGATAVERPERRRGFTSLLSVIIIIAVVVMVVGTYLYEKSLSSQVDNAKQALATARDGIGTDFVSDMKRLDDRITSVRTLLNDHVVVTPIFQALQSTTLHSIQYTSFTYMLQNDPETSLKTVDVTLTGTTKSYATLALQSDAFQGSTLIKNPVFSDLQIDDTTNAVKFKLNFSVDAQALSYERFIASLTPAAQAQVPVIPSVVTTPNQ